jgi:ABC-2 type transport system permease protein
MRLTLFRFATPFLLSVIFLGLALRALFRSREISIQVLLFTSLPSTTAIPEFLGLTQMGAAPPDVREEWLVPWALCGVSFALAWAAGWWEGRQPEALLAR